MPNAEPIAGPAPSYEETLAIINTGLDELDRVAMAEAGYVGTLGHSRNALLEMRTKLTVDSAPAWRLSTKQMAEELLSYWHHRVAQSEAEKPGVSA